VKNTKENVQRLIVKKDELSAEIMFTPEAGKIIGCVAYPRDENDLKNTDFVNVSLQDNNGGFLSKSQDIRNYRSRNSEYTTGCKPLNVLGGTQMTLRVESKTPFTDDFAFQFILIYEKEEDFNCNI